MPRARCSSKKNNSTANLGFEAKLWRAADKLRSNTEAAEYKHAGFGDGEIRNQYDEGRTRPQRTDEGIYPPHNPFIRKLAETTEAQVLGKQLLRSGTSVGVNAGADDREQ